MGSEKLTAYDNLRSLVNEAAPVTYQWVTSGRATDWRLDVKTAIRRLLGEKSEHLKSFDRVTYSPTVLTDATPQTIFEQAFLSGMKEAAAIARAAISEFEAYDMDNETQIGSKSTSITRSQSNRVFVVHGHNNEMKQEVARFLEQLDLEPIILHEQPNGGKTVIEKFEAHSDVSFAVVLMSPDDVGAESSQRRKLKPRARQNVILELGYFVGKLGRSHVCAIVKGDIEEPSDIHGVVYVHFVAESWKHDLIKELKHSGFSVDANIMFKFPTPTSPS